MVDQVECHSGYTYGERPIAFQWQGQRMEVVEVVQRWRDPDGKGFQVRTSMGQIFTLFYRENDGEWRICPL